MANRPHLIALRLPARGSFIPLCVLLLLSAGFVGAAWGQSSAMPGYEEKLQAKLKHVDATIAQGPFRPSWDSLERYKVPDWYLDGKFGIFIHWGVYSVPAFDNEWYPRMMYLEGGKDYKHQVELH